MIEPPEVPHAHHADHGDGPARHPLLRWVFEAVMPISVLLLSIGSLAVALHTGQAMDRLVAHNERLVKAQSTPIVMFENSNFDVKRQQASLLFSVRNVGTGPARLHWLRIDHQGKRFEDPGAWLFGLASTEEKHALRTATVVTGGLDGGVIPAREEKLALQWEMPQEQDTLLRAIWERANQQRRRISGEYCYCSVFDECWRQTLGSSLARPVARCEEPAAVAAPALASPASSP